MNNANYYDFMTIKDLKEILNELPDETLVVIPVVDEDDVNYILGFRKVRTAGILKCETEEPSEVLCLNGAADGKGIDDQLQSSGLDVGIIKVLYGDFSEKEKANDQS